MKYCTLPLFIVRLMRWQASRSRARSTRKEQNQRALGDEELSDYKQRYTAILQAGVEEAGKEAPPASGGRGPRKPSKSQNLLDRLGGYREETLAFERRCGAL
jgi:hypothetical protein